MSEQIEPFDSFTVSEASRYSIEIPADHTFWVNNRPKKKNTTGKVAIVLLYLNIGDTVEVLPTKEITSLHEGKAYANTA